jgi:hypothetical protein
MISILEYINEAYQATYLKGWKPVEKLYDKHRLKVNDDNILGVFRDNTWKWKHKLHGHIYIGMLNKNEISDPEVKLYSDKGVFTSIKDIQDAYNTTEKNLSKLVQEHKIKMSLSLNNFNIYVKIIDRGDLWYRDIVKEGLTLNGVGKSLGKCSFETFSVVDIDLSNPDNNDAKYVYKNYSQVSVKRAVETSARKDGGRKATGYCSFTFVPYHNYEEVENNVIRNDQDRNLLPALLLLYLKNTNITFDGKKISLSLFKNQLELQEDKYKDFKNFIDEHVKSLNADILKRHKEYLQSDDYKNAEARRKHDDNLLMTNGM